MGQRTSVHSWMKLMISPLTTKTNPMRRWTMNWVFRKAMKPMITTQKRVQGPSLRITVLKEEKQQQSQMESGFTSCEEGQSKNLETVQTHSSRGTQLNKHCSPSLPHASLHTINWWWCKPLPKIGRNHYLQFTAHQEDYCLLKRLISHLSSNKYHIIES